MVSFTGVDSGNYEILEIRYSLGSANRRELVAVGCGFVVAVLRACLTVGVACARACVCSGDGIWFWGNF